MKHNVLPLFILAAVLAATPVAGQCTYPTPVTPESCAAAAAYNASTNGVSFLVWVDGQQVCEDYPFPASPTDFHEIWSGTKSFWGVIAGIAIEEGLIGLDEIVADTITEWQADPWKSLITVRHLLSLTDGLQADEGGGGSPTYANAIAMPALHEPGTFWEYGAVPYQCFGEFMRRKLAPEFADPVEYLQDRILDTIGATYSEWSYGTDGNPLLDRGSRWLASEWIQYGELVRLGGFWPGTGERIVPQELMDQAFQPSPIKDDYGLTWWLAPPGVAGYPCDTVVARGAGTQLLYVIRSRKTVILRQTTQIWHGWNYVDTVLLDLLFVEDDPQDNCPPAPAGGLTVERTGSDLMFGWNPVQDDISGSTELLAGHELWKATSPDFSDGQLHLTLDGPMPGGLATGEGGAEAGLVFYKVRAFDKCGNAGE
ncbi:MAG: serine hydrolase [Acidobacteria bacterium]|uniref:Serine hydrolase n=1 Tax=Candidatus Polarisedimenticola svalbardensis TaxID=2886004 RepID=A0A8J6Y9Y5_9BACT|nr:serine hydrolase [Candidatus Polarisedimenticola svalbardensis]